jgi:hypothetical protein
MPTTPARWYSLPVVWLSAAIFVASLAGGIHLIVTSSRLPDESLRHTDDALLHVPASRESQSTP